MSDAAPWEDYQQPDAGPWSEYAPPSPPQDSGGVMGALKGASRALEANLPFVDRAVAYAKTALPRGYGGTGGDLSSLITGADNSYAANLAAEQAKNQQFAQANPWANAVGGIAASAPLLAVGGPSFGLGGMTGRVASSAVPMAAIGAAQGASSSPDLSDLSQTGVARNALIGAGTGGLIGAAVPLAGAGIAKAISPFAISPERQAMVEGLRQAGINPTAGQVTGNRTLAKLEAAASDIPFGGGGAEVAREANSRAFTAALMEKAGAPPGQIATQENLNALHESLGDQFDALGARNSISVDPQLATDLTGAVRGYHDVTGAPAPGVAKTAKDLLSEDISGAKYNNVRSQLGKQAQSLRFTDPAQAQAYRDMQGGLDDAMERSIAANNPDDAGAFQEVRAKYKNLAAIEQARGSAGTDTASGIISPAQMRTALASGNNRRAYARGIGDLAPLTNAGNAVLTNFPQSGTAPRILAAHLLGAGLGGGVGGIPGGMIGTVVAPAVGARALMSRPVQSLLANQLMRGPAGQAAANRAAMAAALAARPQLTQRQNTE